MNPKYRHSDPIFSKICILWPFVLSIIYWGYLLFNTNTVVIFDSVEYQTLGKMIHTEGWIEYFKTGPNREPFYPFMISISMSLGNLLSCSYLTILKIIQLLILFSTQILSLKILQKLKINSTLTTLTILYVGFSPALLNTALSLYSEIATYPFILSIIVLTDKLWNQLLTNKSLPRILLTSILLSVCFVAATFSKSIFEIITPFYLFCLFLLTFKKSKKLSITKSTLAIVCCFLFFFVSLSSFKTLNKKHNGHYALTNRGSWMLYGSVIRRTKKLTLKKFLTALSYAPGEGVCQRFFNGESCNFWSFQQTDAFGMQKLSELNTANIPKDKIDKILFKLSSSAFLHNPFQYALLTGIEGLKMFFWESTKIGFVEYPPWLTKLYDFKLFKDGIRLLLFLMTIFSTIFSINYLWEKRNLSNKNFLLFLILAIIIPFSSLYAIFSILTRYALPIAPLFLILIAFTFDQIIFDKNSDFKNHEK